MARVVGGSGVGRRVRGGERKKVTVGVDQGLWVFARISNTERYEN